MPGRGRLEGKVAIITGAARGIGLATARLFAAEGASVALFDKDAEAASIAARELVVSGAAAVGIDCDITDPARVRAGVDAVQAHLGPIGILVNNAGATLTKAFVDTTMDDIDVLVGINLKGLVLMSQAVIPDMIALGGGAIVHDASNAGIVGRPWQPLYGATKAGIVSLAKSMALSLAKDRIRVNCICPGSIDTPMLRSALSTSGVFNENWRKTELVIPLGRIGQPEDIAYATLFLASDEAAYITGVALPVDGGRTAGVPETFHLDRGRQDYTK